MSEFAEGQRVKVKEAKAKNLIENGDLKDYTGRTGILGGPAGTADIDESGSGEVPMWDISWDYEPNEDFRSLLPDLVAEEELEIIEEGN